MTEVDYCPLTGDRALLPRPVDVTPVPPALLIRPLEHLMSYSLRDLPLPVKVVASVFLMAVGVGYTAAMVQLHMQDSKSGKPMPTIADVVKKYTGKVEFDPNNPPPAPMSRLEALVTADVIDISGQTMAGAFTTHDQAKGDLKFKKAIEGKSAEHKRAIEEERKGEQLALKLWINAKDADRKAAYEADKFTPPAGKMPKALTPALMDGSAVKIKALIGHRCATCHSKGGEKEDVPLDTYDGLTKFMGAGAPAPAGKWVKVEEPISLTKLTQSTHAHLLSFAMLFSLTGLIFAFSSYPTGLRCVLGPWVVLAVFADVSLWWLARLCDQWGPYFAQAIVFTGMFAGAGLFGQIVLSLFNMYGPKGKLVMGGLFVIGGVIASLVVVNVIEPGLRDKQNALQKGDKPDDQPNGKPPEKKPDDKKGDENKSPKLDEKQLKELQEALGDLQSDDAGKKQSAQQKFDKAVGEAKRKEIEHLLKDTKSDTRDTREAAQAKLAALGFPIKDVPKVAASQLENLLTFPVKGPDGKVLTMAETPWTGGEDGNMARAFYDKEKFFKEFMEDAAKTQAEKDKLMAERDSERQALIAWVRSAEPARKATYDADAFPLPAELAGKPITAKYLKDGKVSVQTIIANRCLRCHGPPDGKQYEEYPLDTYAGLKKYLDPLAAAAPAPVPPAVAPAPPAVPAPVPTARPVEPIPDAKDD